MKRTPTIKSRRDAGTLFNLPSVKPAPRWERLSILRIEIVPAPSLPATFRRAMIAAELSHLVGLLNTKIPVMNLRHLKQTHTGLLAVHTDPATALDVARRLRLRRPAPGMHVRYGIFWGDVAVGSNGIPIGRESEVLHSILYLSKGDRIIATEAGDLPECDRVLVPSGAIAQLPPELRAQFVCLGSFRVAGCNGVLEIWTETLAAFLGREPTNTERTLGVSGVHPETVLDSRWARRLENAERHNR